MRVVRKKQLKLGETPIAQIQFNPKSRDDIPQILRGLQYVYVTPHVREQVFNILESMIPSTTDTNNGRPGMDLWNILVLGVLRLNLNWDYDRLFEMANNHKLIRKMLGHGLMDENHVYNLQTIKDNACWLSTEIMDKISQVVVESGHRLVKKKELLKAKCDSFVLETDIHYPTDINLLFDALRKMITLTDGLCRANDLPGYRQSLHNIRKIKRLFRKAQNIKRSISQDENKKQKQAKAVRKAHRAYLNEARVHVTKARQTLSLLQPRQLKQDKIEQVKSFIVHAERQIDQIKRRVLEGEQIPHHEKVFSVFEPHSEWICKGKAGVPVQLGLKVCVIEDQYGFMLHQQVMQKQEDREVAVSMLKAAQGKFPQLKMCSFDKGFYTPANKKELGELLELSVLPKKGRLGQKDKEFEYSKQFIEARRAHSAIESGINALQVHGLDRCPDHGIERFKRYVSLAVLARNLQQLGAYLRKQEIRQQQLALSRKKAA